MKVPKFFVAFASLWTVSFWLGCVAVPLSAVLGAGRDGSVWKSFVDPSVLFIVRSTLWQASWSTLISGALGFPLGLAMGGLSHRQGGAGRFQSRLHALLAMPFGVPTVVVGMTWVLWLGRSGVLSNLGLHLEWIYSLKAVILAHGFLNIPWVALMVSQSRREVPEEQVEAARTLGASGFAELRFVLWPRVRWAFACACAQVFSLCVMSFALVLILGGGPPVQTLETELFGRLRYSALDISGAVACALWEGLVTGFPWVMMLFFQSRRQSLHQSWRRSWQRSLPQVSVSVSAEREPARFSLRKMVLLFLSLFFIMPYLAVVNRQILLFFMDSNRRQMILEPMRLSLVLALSCGGISVFTALMAMGCLLLFRSRPTARIWVNVLLSVPSGVSVLVLSLGVWLAYGSWLDPFEGSLWAMIALQSTLFFPVALRALWPVAQSIQLSQLESAISLGASSVRAFWYVEFPRWKGPILAALAGVVGASLGEVGAVSLFYSEKLIPLPLLVSRWMGQYRFEEAQGVAGLLFLLSSFLIAASFELGNGILE